MTPLTRFFARILPGPVAIGALALAYAGMMFAILVAGEVKQVDIIYVDVRDE
jgi:hypothetical protein